jgi:hypothetical protein
MKHVDGLLALVLAYGTASLAHHVHNALYLDTYPHMPAFLSSAWVYGAWCCVAAIGLGGYLSYRLGHRLPGLVLLAAYAGIGLYGLGHYRLAPISAHTPAMNVTIALEVGTATMLLIAVARLMLKRSRRGRDGESAAT